MFEGTSPRARRRLNEAGDKVRVQHGVCLLRVHFVRAGLDRLCSGRDLNFKGVLKACAYFVSVALRASIELGSQPGASSVPEAEEKIRINSRATQKFGGFRPGNRA